MNSQSPKRGSRIFFFFGGGGGGGGGGGWMGEGGCLKATLTFF